MLPRALSIGTDVYIRVVYKNASEEAAKERFLAAQLLFFLWYIEFSAACCDTRTLHSASKMENRFDQSQFRAPSDVMSNKINANVSWLNTKGAFVGYIGLILGGCTFLCLLMPIADAWLAAFMIHFVVRPISTTSVSSVPIVRESTRKCPRVCPRVLYIQLTFYMFHWTRGTPFAAEGAWRSSNRHI